MDMDEEFFEPQMFKADESQDYNGEFHNQNHYTQFETEIPAHVTQITIDRYQSLAEQNVDTKNIPKTFGNNFKKFLENLSKQLKVEKKTLPKGLQTFIEKKQVGKQSNYTLADFKAFFSCSIYLMYSNRIRNPEELIQFIEQYLAGARDMENFISNRPVGSLKTNKKKEKEEEAQDKIVQKEQMNNYSVPDQQYQDQDDLQIQQDWIGRKNSYQDIAQTNNELDYN